MKKLAINPSNKKYYSDDYIKGWENGVNAQYEATKDAVEVVRCKDCKWEKECCRNIRPEGRRSEDYCSYGKRREDGEACIE